MKNLILVALAFITFQGIAQENKKSHKKGDHQKRMAMTQLSANEIATLQTKKMTLFLDLNESQQRDIQKINLRNAAERKAHMEARKAKKESGTASKPTSEERFAMMNDMLDKKIAAKAEMKKILNADQYEKWEKVQAKMSAKRKGHGKKKGQKGDHKKQ